MNAVLQIIAALYAEDVQEGLLKSIIDKINDSGLQVLPRNDMEVLRRELPGEAGKMARLNWEWLH